MADVLEQGRLARAAHPGHAHQTPERDPDVDPLQVVLRRAAHEEVAGVVLLRPDHRRPSCCDLAPAARRSLHRGCRGDGSGAFGGACGRLGSSTAGS